MEFYKDIVIYCYSCRKRTVFTCKDTHEKKGVDSHCSECTGIWFEWQNRAVEREMEKWVAYNKDLVNNMNH
ncbi:hypothetical protein MHB40_17840 [Lysinibacillus sp. FSL K6-0057]|uniref:hypothetical protein n=1 Tax=Lysinibacillus sp. FSL K6-0057 TaxID=2921411 RepID=UPI003159CD0F